LTLWVTVALWSLALGGRFALHRIWTSSGKTAILAIVVTLAAFHLQGFIRGCDPLGDVLHFIAASPDDEHVITRLPRDGHPQLVVFNWGGYVWGSHGQVYDESDEVALPSDRQSAAWRSNPNLAESAAGDSGVEQRESHYPLASFPCWTGSTSRAHWVGQWRRSAGS
jgi:hypothetical protein